MFQIYYKCDFCYIFIQSDGARLISAEFTGICGDDKPCELLKFAARELDLYFAGRLQSFASPLLVQGSPFQKAVYQALLEIPYGQTATYKDIARKVRLKNAVNSGFGAASGNLALKNGEIQTKISSENFGENRGNLDENLAFKNGGNLDEISAGNLAFKNGKNLAIKAVKNTEIFGENSKNLPIRAVGNANAKNKLPIFIPCHRVVAANGLGGYSCGRDLSVNLDKNFYENFYKKLGKNLGNLNGNLSENSDINLRNLNKNSSKNLDINLRNLNENSSKNLENLSKNSSENSVNLNKNLGIKPLDIKRFLLNLEGVDIAKFW